MAMTNGTFEISSGGTLTDFFEAMKTGILAHTDWTPVEDECTELKLAFTSSRVPNAKIVITDNSITSTDSTASSNQLKIAIYDNLDVVRTSNIYVTYISTGCVQTTTATRSINLFTYDSNGIYLCEFIKYSATTPSFPGSSVTANANHFFWVGAIDAINVSTGETETLYPLYRTFYTMGDDLSTTSYYSTKAISGTSEGVVMINYLIDSTYKYALSHVYNCSTLTAGLKYSINGKKYLAINTHTLFEL